MHLSRDTRLHLTDVPAGTPVSGPSMAMLPPAAEDDRIEIRQVVRSLWRRKLMILGLMILSALALFGLTSTQAPQYSARATLMLDPREQRIVASDQVVSNFELNNPILESEVAVLRSRDLMERTLERLGVERFAALDPARAEGGGIMKVLGLGGAPADTAPDTPAEAQNRFDRILNHLTENTRISRVGESYVIEVQVQSTDPELSALLANALVAEYIGAQLSERQSVVEDATRWLSEEVASRRSELAQAETEIQAFKRAQLENAGVSIEVLEQQLADMNQQLSLVRSERTAEEARLATMETNVSRAGAVSVAETERSVYLDTLRADLETARRDNARLAGEFGPNHPDRQDVMSQINQIETAIEREVANIVQSYRNEIAILRTREQVLAGDVEQLEEKLADISDGSLRLLQLERDAQSSRETYEALLARLGEIRAQVEIQRAQAKVVSRATVPVHPSAPRPRLMGAFGATLGLTLGLLAALASEFFKQGYTRRSELETATGLQVFAALPAEKVRRGSDVLAHLRRTPYSLLSERVRQLRRQISLTQQSDGEGHSVLLTSSVPNEGKTFTAMALAQSFARSGRSTLLLDFDSRRPFLHAQFAEPETPDLATYFRGGATLDEVITRRDTLEFDIAGFARPSEVLADQVREATLDSLLRTLKGRYDLVIIDTPPVLAVSDGLTLARCVDDVLYVVRWGRTPRRSVQYGLASLRGVGVQPLGLVMTQADVDAEPEDYAMSYEYGS